MEEHVVDGAETLALSQFNRIRVWPPELVPKIEEQRKKQLRFNKADIRVPRK
jgi:hypothetical protein